jgi:hypothetical protein
MNGKSVLWTDYIRTYRSKHFIFSFLNLGHNNIIVAKTTKAYSMSCKDGPNILPKNPYPERA